jgi:alkylated DNA nucleotide flippase Atl1
MTPFLSGALGALTLLAGLALVRRAVWSRRLHRWRAGRGLPLRRLFARLGTRPEQEQLLAAEAEALWGELSALGQDGRSLRTELAELFAGASLEPSAVTAALDARLARLQTLRSRLVEALGRIHAALEPAQRERLVALLRSGRPGRRHAHC